MSRKINPRTLCAVERCERPVGDNAYVCSRCATEMAQALGDVTAVIEEFNPARHPVYPAGHPLAQFSGQILPTQFGRGRSTRWDTPAGERGNLPRELALARYRQATTSRNGGRAAETPVPWDQRAREATWVLDNVIGTWARLVSEERGVDLPEPADTSALARWLLSHVEWLRHHPAGAEAVDEITSAVGLASAVVDIRPERWYAGPCDDCSTDLYGRPGAYHVVCPNDSCGRMYDVKTRRDHLLAAAEDRLASAALIARAVTSLGKPVNDATIRKWASRGRIVAHGVDLKGRPLYRVGDVLDLVAEDSHRSRSSRSA